MSIVKSFSVGNGDMFYISHNSDNFTTIDCCYSDEKNRDTNFEEIRSLATKKGITRFISTHPDEDHIRGISKFCETVGIANFYCVKNEATKADESESFIKYCELRDSKKAFYLSSNCKRKWMNVTDKERGSSGINVLWPKTTNEEFTKELLKAKLGEAYNNLSPIFTYSINASAKIMWMGDIEHDFLEKVKDEISWPSIDILFAPHHGRDSAKLPCEILQKLDPKIIVVGEAPSKYLNYCQGYNTITQNSAGDIIFECDNNFVHIFVSKLEYLHETDFLENLGRNNINLGYYLGSFKPKDA